MKRHLTILCGWFLLTLTAVGTADDSIPAAFGKAAKMVIAKHDTAFVAFIEYQQLPSNIGPLYCARFPATNYDPANLLIDTLEADVVVTGLPSVAADKNTGGVYMCYGKDNQVYYTERDASGSWATPIPISNSTNPCSEASIDVYGGKVYVTWTEDEAVGKQVYRRDKDVGYDWYRVKGQCSDIVTSNSIGAYNPFCASGIALWAENIDNSTYAIKYKGTNATDTVNTLYSAAHLESYPSGVLGSDPSTLYAIWTETVLGVPGAGPYISGVKFAQETVKKIAYLDVQIGLATASPYTVYRDGYKTYPSGISVDYSSNELVYNLPYLVPANDYTLQIIGYHESSGKWDQQARLDGKETRVMKVTAGKPDTLVMDIPRNYYKDDKQVELRIKRLTGDYAAVKSITVYQTERPVQKGKGGAQLTENSEFAIQNYEFRLAPCYPNPAAGHTTIRYSLPKAGTARLKIYNISGQLVKTLVEGERPAGIHSIAWDCKNDVGRQVANGVYLYRLCTKENTETHKLTIIK